MQISNCKIKYDNPYVFFAGVAKFLELVKDAEQEYEKDYRVEYERLRKAKAKAEEVPLNLTTLTNL